MNEDILLKAGTMITSAFRGFARDYILDEDLTTIKTEVWVTDEFDEAYKVPVETIVQVVRG
jgi:hypothetical protein